MKKVLFLIVSIVILGLVFAGCGGITNITTPGTTETESISYLTRNGYEGPYDKDSPKIIELLAGQDINVGQVEVWNDAENLHITYVIDEPGWYLTETHLHVACDESDIPQNKKGNPIPGHFDYSSEHEISDIEIEEPFVISLDSIGCCNPVIAAHAVVVHVADEVCEDLYSDGTEEFSAYAGSTCGDTTIRTGTAKLAWEPYSDSDPSVWDNRINHPFVNADWIWESYRTVNPICGDIVWFTKTFDIPGLYLVDATASMYATCDNGYEFHVNSVLQGSAQLGEGWESSNLTQSFVDRDGWQWVENYDFVNDLKLGTNTLLFKAANEYMGPLDTGSITTPGNIDSNPAGLIYEGQVCYTVVDQEETAWGDGDRFVEANDPEDSDEHGGGNWATYFTYPIQPVQICIDFSALGLEPGDSIEGQDTVYTGLEIDATYGDAIILAAGLDPKIYGADNASSGENGCLDSTGGFSYDSMSNLNNYEYVFTFDYTVSEFSLRMLDFGDYNPTHATNHLVTMTAYDSYGNEVGTVDTLQYTSSKETNPGKPGGLYLTGDACDAVEGDPGNWLWEVSGSGIVSVELIVVEGLDPKIAFDNLCFTIYECVE